MQSGVELWFIGMQGVGTILQAGFLIVSIYFVNRQFGIVRACSYMERFNSEETRKRRAVVDQWLESSDDEDQKITKFDADPDLRTTVLGFMNLFQELGIAYLRHNVHKPTVQYSFDILVPSYWARLQFLVDHLRKTRSPTAYRHLEQLAKKLGQVGMCEIKGQTGHRS
jgi:hypothetical protein